MEKISMTSFQKSSLVQKFHVFFVLIAILPIGVLYYLYTQMGTENEAKITPDILNTTLIWVMIGVAVGYLAMRRALLNLIRVTRASRDSLRQVLGQEKVQQASDNTQDEIAMLTRTFNEVTTRLQENVKNLELAQKTLHSVMERVGKGMNSFDNINQFLNLIVETVTDALLGKKGMLLLVDDKRDCFFLKAAYGMKVDEADPLTFKTNQGIFAAVIQTKSPMVFQGMGRDPVDVTEGMKVFEYPIICTPLLLRDEVQGILVVSGRTINSGFTQDDTRMLYNIGLQTAVAIENDELNLNVEVTYLETLSALALAVEARDPYSRGHLERVAQNCMRIGEKLGLDEEQLKVLRDAARIHDLGKIGVPDEVLDKPDKLTAEEWAVMKKHPEIGESIIKPIKSLLPLCDIVRHHHEKLDGSGYPDGLKGDELTLPVRIIAVADVFDALTMDRPYRKGYTEKKAFEILREMNMKVDQRIVDVFERILES